MKLTRFYFKHGSYYFVDYKNKWHNLGKHQPTAIRRYTELVEGAARTTLNDVFDRFEREVIPKKAALTQRDYRSGLKLLRSVFGELQPGDLTAPQIYTYMDKRQSEVRANREKALLSTVYAYAIRWGLAERNPCRDVQSFTEQPRRRYVTDTEFWAIHDVAPPALQRAMQIALCTGLRLSDILALTTAHCTPDGLLVRPAKTSKSTGKTLIFQWTDDLRALCDYPSPPDSAVPVTPLIATKTGKPYTRSGFQTVWRRLMLKVFPKEGDQFTFHDIRAKAGSDSDDGKLLGHADTRTLNRHYRRKPQAIKPLDFTR